MKNISILFIVLILFSNITFADEFNEELIDIEGHWAEKYIEFAVKNGYASGYPDKTFKPNQDIKVDEFISLVVRTNENFKIDKTINYQYWATPFINYALENELIQKDEFKNFQRALSREEMAMIAVRLLGKTEMILGQLDTEIMSSINDYPMIDDDMKQYVLSAYETGLISGKPGNIFDPKGTATRAETMVVIQRLKDESVRTPFVLENVPSITARYEAWTDIGWQWLPITVYAPLDDEGNRITDALDMYAHFREEEIAQDKGTVGVETIYNPYGKVIGFNLYPDNSHLNMDTEEKVDYKDFDFYTELWNYDFRDYKYYFQFTNDTVDADYYNDLYEDELNIIYDYFFEEQAEEMKLLIDRILNSGPRIYEDKIEETYELTNGRILKLISDRGRGFRITDKSYEQ